MLNDLFVFLMLTLYNSGSRVMIVFKLTLLPSIILKLQAYRCFLLKTMNALSYKSQYKPVPESNCWQKISAYKWQLTLDKPTSGLRAEPNDFTFVYTLRRRDLFMSILFVLSFIFSLHLQLGYNSQSCSLQIIVLLLRVP